MNIHDSAFTFYWVSGLQFFKNLEEVKKVIHAGVDTGQPVFAAARKTMGFDCIKPIHD